MYITYADYVELNGNAIEEGQFKRLAFKACKKIDLYTQNRLKNETVVSDAVKLCIVELVELINDEEQNSSERQITSSSNDGVSISFATARTAEEYAIESVKIIEEYLAGEMNSSGVPLLYRGF